jgi:hypothetical protein
MRSLIRTATSVLALPAATDERPRVRSLTGDFPTAGVERVESRLTIEPNRRGNTLEVGVAGRSIEGSGWLGHKVRWDEGAGLRASP